jgi:phosphoribosylaminoimidazolecarboxamide formyltransferase/IMP cyclohydrolase
MPRALLSVSDKRGIVAFATSLTRLGWEIVSTGGTARLLHEEGVAVTPVDQVTGFPEILDGRVKTLHPAVHAGLLARPDHEEHLRQLNEHHLEPFALVAVNLYPFRETVADPEVSRENAIENIDIGGPSMLRSAAKNHENVLPVIDPRDYDRVIALIKEGNIPLEVRQEFAAKVFTLTADYDNAIAGYLTAETDALPARVTLAMERHQVLRYGENPNQRAGLYTSEEPRGIGDLTQRQGKELSFNNLLDIDAAMLAVAGWKNLVACAVIKHTTPCGLAVAATPAEAFARARATDPTSAFGSVVAFNTVVDESVAEAMRDLFVEVVVAPAFHAGALAIFAAKKNLRVVELPVPSGHGHLDWKRIRGGFLIQDAFTFDPTETAWRVATSRQPTEREYEDLRFAWAACSTVKSNAILIARDSRAIGIGAGQMSRVDASFLAVHKARQAGHDPAGAVLASDGFFPFADGVEEAAKAGITAIIQPGGSVRDAEVTAAADRLGMAMIMTGQRMFRH